MIFIGLIPNRLITQDLAYQVFDVDDGLPSSEVYDVEIDAKGNLWFSTERGLCKYDGYLFEIYNSNNGLTGNTIFEIIKLEDSSLFCSCYNGTTFCYKDEVFTPMPFNDQFANKNLSSWIKQISKNQDGDYVMSIYTYESLKYKGTYLKYEVDKDSLFELKPEISQAYTVFGVDQNKFIYIKEYDVFTHTYLELGEDEYIIALDRKSIAISSKNRINWADANSKFLHLRDGKIINSADTEVYIRRLFKDSNNSIWYCTDKGLYPLNTNLQNVGKNGLLKEFDISSIIEDYENNIWLTTVNKGIVLIPSLYIRNIRNENIDSSRVKSLATYGNKILLSSHNGGISYFDKNLNLSKIETLEKDLHLLQKDQYGLYTHDNSQFIIDSDNRIKLKIKNLNFGIFAPFIRYGKSNIILGKNSLSLYNSSSKRLNPKPIYDFKERLTTLNYGDSQEELYVGSFKGLYHTKNFKSKVFEKLSPKILNSRIAELIPSENGFFVATMGNGLYHLDKSHNLSHLTNNIRYPVENINCLYLLNKNRILLGTNTGLYNLELKYNEGTPSIINISNYTVNNGLSSNFIYDIEEYNNQIWLSTEKGVNYFSPDNFLRELDTPKIFLDSIVSNLGMHKCDKEEHTLSSETNELKFYLSSVSFKRSRNYPFIRYQLQHQEKDTSWILTNDNIIPLYNLSSGHYKLIAQSRNNLYNWSSTPLEYNFEIAPKFYETLLFRWLGIFTGLFLGIMIYRYYTARTLRKQEDELKLKRIELKGKKAELDALRGQMNPHFIYNALNSIQNFIFKGEEENASLYMSKVSRLMRSSLEMSKLELISIEDEIKFLKNYLDLEKMRFENKFEYTIDITEVSPKNKIPPLLVQPLIENTIKHGFVKMDNKLGQLSISFKNSNENLIVIIEDNGKGLATSDKAKNNSEYKSLSTTIIKERLQIINKSNRLDTCKLLIKNNFINNEIKGVIAQLFLPLDEAYV